MNSIIEFHRKSAEGREAFRKAVAELIAELKDIRNKEFFSKRIQKFEADLQHSQKSLSSVIRSDGADFGYSLLSVGLPMAFGAFGVIGMAGDPWSFHNVGNSALLGIVSALCDHIKSRRTTWSSKEASYWLSLHAAFKSDNGVSMQLPRMHRKFEEFIND